MKSADKNFNLVCIVLLALMGMLSAVHPPGPNPPGPTPIDEKLIEGDGLQMLVVFDREKDWHQLEPDQMDIFLDLNQAGELRRWVDDNVNDWEEISPHDPVEYVSDKWKNAMTKSPSTKVPWFIISGDKGSWAGTPKSIDETMKMLKELK